MNDELPFQINKETQAVTKLLNLEVNMEGKWI